jgi:hypothetical protein
MAQKLKVRKRADKMMILMWGDNYNSQSRANTANATSFFAGEFVTFKNGDELRFGTETIAKVEVRDINLFVYFIFLFESLKSTEAKYFFPADCCSRER